MNFTESAMEKDKIIERVRKQFPENPWPTPIKEPIWTGRFEKKPVEGWFSLQNKDTGDHFQFVSDAYALVHNEELVDKTMEAVEDLKTVFGEPKFNFGFYKNGARFRFSVSFPDAQKDVALKDPVAPTMSVRNCFDKSRKVVFEKGATELVCTNGMIVPKLSGTIQKRHIGDFNIPEIKEEMRKFIESFPQTTAIWQKWTQAILDNSMYEQLWEELPLSEKEREKIEALPLIGTKNALKDSKEGKIVLWDVNRAVTQYLSHEMKSETRAEDIGPHIANIFSKYSD